MSESLNDDSDHKMQMVLWVYRPHVSSFQIANAVLNWRNGNDNVNVGGGRRGEEEEEEAERNSNKMTFAVLPFESGNEKSLAAEMYVVIH